MKIRTLLCWCVVIGVEFAFCMCLSAENNAAQRIVSLGPSITESLYLLGEEQQLVGVTTYCSRPAQAKTKEKVGTVRDANVEKIIALQPDLVIATSLTSPKAVEKLRKIGIKVVVFVEPKNYTELREQFTKLAVLVGKEEVADQILSGAEMRINAVKEKVRHLPHPDVFVQIGAKPLFAAIGKSFINDFIVFAGANNIASDAATGLYSREEVLRKNPQVILIVTMGIVGEQEKAVWEKYTAVDAVKNKRIYIIDSDKICSPTPLGFAQTLEEMVVILHPKVKGEQLEK